MKTIHSHRPGIFDFTGRRKHNAWESKKGACQGSMMWCMYETRMYVCGGLIPCL